MNTEIYVTNGGSVILRINHPSFPKYGDQNYRDIDLTSMRDILDTLEQDTQDLDAVIGQAIKDSALNPTEEKK